MKDKLRSSWNALTPEKKKKAVLALVVGSVLAVALIGYKVSRPATPVQAPDPASEKKEISLAPKMLEKSQFLDNERRMSELEKQLEGFKKEKEEQGKLEEEKAKIAVAQQMPKGVLPPPPPPGQASQGQNLGFPPPPAGMPQPAKPVVEVIGDIGVVSNEAAAAPKEAAKDDKKKQTIYLPPSFMAATLLTGVRAKTHDGGKSNPIPMMLRVKDLAILPNKVKANLKGCFVIAEGTGSLDSETVDIRLISLSCLTKKGRSVIDQKIKGFVVDDTAFVGLSGRVVSKMGAVAARGVLAGFLGGFGEAAKTAFAPQSIIIPSAGVETRTGGAVFGDIVKAGVGSGVAQGATELQKEYIDLLRQSRPVIEVGATKQVTVVISEGVELEIKENCGGGSCAE